MTKEDFENVDIMNDREEITFYKNLFKTLKGNYKEDNFYLFSKNIYKFNV